MLTYIFEPRFKIMLQCWEEDPEKRPSFTEMLSTLNTCAGLFYQSYLFLSSNPQYCSAIMEVFSIFRYGDWLY